MKGDSVVVLIFPLYLPRENNGQRTFHVTINIQCDRFLDAHLPSTGAPRTPSPDK